MITLNVTTLYNFAKHAAAGLKMRNPVLQSVMVEITEDRTLYVATDGSILACKWEDNIDNPPIGKYRIPADIILRCKPVKYLPGAILDPEAMTFNYAGVSFKFENEPDNFPDWRRVVPETCDGDIAQYDAASLVRIASTLGCETKALQLHHNGTGAAVVTAKENPCCFGLVMPFHIKFQAEINDNPWTRPAL